MEKIRKTSLNKKDFKNKEKKIKNFNLWVVMCAFPQHEIKKSIIYNKPGIVEPEILVIFLKPLLNRR
jgi:hypothetical protein